ncbi:MAG: BC1881 family protein [Clostridia bacterium]
MNLSKVPTCDLVEELSKREAVEKIVVEPYQDYKITVGEKETSDDGPVVILRIWD